MGSVVGEKLTRLVERGIAENAQSSLFQLQAVHACKKAPSA